MNLRGRRRRCFTLEAEPEPDGRLESANVLQRRVFSIIIMRYRAMASRKGRVYTEPSNAACRARRALRDGRILRPPVSPGKCVHLPVEYVPPSIAKGPAVLRRARFVAVMVVIRRAIEVLQWYRLRGGLVPPVIWIRGGHRNCRRSYLSCRSSSRRRGHDQGSWRSLKFSRGSAATRSHSVSANAVSAGCWRSSFGASVAGVKEVRRAMFSIFTAACSLCDGERFECRAECASCKVAVEALDSTQRRCYWPMRADS
jgi:hypothetical protein